MPTIPLNEAFLILILVVSTIPGLSFPPRELRTRLRPVRPAAGLLLGSLAGWILGRSTLDSGLPIPPTVLALLAATTLLAEGAAGRGWPFAGTVSATIYLATVALDLLDRTGERGSWTLWPITFGIGLVVASVVQSGWRVVWNGLSRLTRRRTSSEAENGNSR